MRARPHSYVDEQSRWEICRDKEGKVWVDPFFARDGDSPTGMKVEVTSSLHDEKTTVIRCDFEEGAALPRHWHRQTETVVMLEGMMILEMDGEATTMKKGDHLTVPANHPHSAKALTPCLFLVIFAPSIELTWTS